MKSKLRTSLLLFCGLLFLISPAFAFDESTQEFTTAEKKFEAKKYAEAEPLYRQAYLKYKNMGRLAAYIQVKIGECCQYQHKTEDAVLVYRNVQTAYPASPLSGQMQEKIARAYYETNNTTKPHRNLRSSPSRLRQPPQMPEWCARQRCGRQAKAIRTKKMKPWAMRRIAIRSRGIL